MEKNNSPTIVNDGADIERLNQLFDKLLEKPFLSPAVALNAIRAALDLHGIILPTLDVETQDKGPNSMAALNYLMSGKRLAAPIWDCEYLFKIADYDHDEDIKAGKVGREDWDNYLYLYIVLDRNEDLGVYEAYAQIVDADDVDALIHENIPKDLADLYPDLMGDDYEKQVRQAGTGGYNDEV